VAREHFGTNTRHLRTKLFKTAIGRLSCGDDQVINPDEAKTYNQFRLPDSAFHKRKYDLVMKKVLKGGFQKVLEIGAGTGVYTKFLLQDFGCVVATDKDAEMCKKMVNIFSGIKPLHMPSIGVEDACNLSFQADEFDGIFGVSILHHIPECDMANGDKEPNDRKKVWQEIARVLKPNGWFAFCEPNANNIFTRFVHWYYKEDAMSCSEMMRDAEQVGLKIIDYGTLQFCSPRTMWVTKIPLWNAFERLVERFGLGVSAYVVGTK